MQELPSKYFTRYRRMLGLSSQQTAKEFFAAKDIVPSIDFAYASELRDRITLILVRVNSVLHESVRRTDIDEFCTSRVGHAYSTILEHDLLRRLNNQGRRPEQVLFSWLRGWAFQCYFSASIASVFGSTGDSVRVIGEDDFTNPDTFKRTPSADLEMRMGGKPVRIEVQSGFQGINDIKQHKVREAERLAHGSGIPTVCAHFDLFNGQAAFVRLDTIDDNDIHWVTRQQMEGQTVFEIDQNSFIWRLVEPPPDASDLLTEVLER